MMLWDRDQPIYGETKQIHVLLKARVNTSYGSPLMSKHSN